ncbi:MAG: heavy metal-responsive transcriptional regulator [Chthoniobacterales bacterium]
MNYRRVESPSLSIGKVARRAGIGVETIRFYEREGLLAAPVRKDSGYRLYPERVIGRIRFIRRAKELGFSLKEIKELLQLRRNSSSTCEDIREKAEAKIANVEAKIAMLNKMKQALTELSAACKGHTSLGECPILEFLEKGGGLE